MAVMKILILAIIQGMAELLPVSSSAHVIVAEKLMGFDPTSPEMTLVLVMLHTGTMCAVIVYYWRAWLREYFASRIIFINTAKRIILATVFTGIIGLALKSVIERIFLRSVPHAEIELLFGSLPLIASSLFLVGLLIIYSGSQNRPSRENPGLSLIESAWIGCIQGLCLPFRGFSRSGATISMGLMLGISKTTVEEFSFALAVVLTPPVIAREVFRLIKSQAFSIHASPLAGLLYPSLLAMIFSFFSGLLALKLLSRWIGKGYWKVFGYYCLTAAIIVSILHHQYGL